MLYVLFVCLYACLFILLFQRWVLAQCRSQEIWEGIWIRIWIQHFLTLKNTSVEVGVVSATWLRERGADLAHQEQQQVTQLVQLQGVC